MSEGSGVSDQRRELSKAMSAAAGTTLVAGCAGGDGDGDNDGGGETGSGSPSS